MAGIRNNTADQVKLLRFLADELEVGRARLELEIRQDSEVVDEPRSWHEPHAPVRKRIEDRGATWTIRATTLRHPKS